MKSAIIRLAALALVLFAAPSRTREVVLVEDGVALAPIVVFEDAPPFTRRAGDHLAEYMERMSGAKPEVIAVRPDGTPGGGEEAWPRERTVKMCHSNPELWRIWLRDVEAQLAANPERMVFNTSPNDGWYSGWCVCENVIISSVANFFLRSFNADRESSAGTSPSLRQTPQGIPCTQPVTPRVLFAATIERR